MLVVLNVVELQEAETDLVVDESANRPHFGCRARQVEPRHGSARATVRIDAALFGDAGRTHLVGQPIKGDDLTCPRIYMLAVAGAGGTRR